MSERHARFGTGHPYRWRTKLRAFLPRPFCWLINKGSDCARAGGEHHWYNQDNRHSACYHCQVVRAGRLWEK